MTELKHCPFCGVKNISFSKHKKSCFIRLLIETIEKKTICTPQDAFTAYQERFTNWIDFNNEEYTIPENTLIILSFHNGHLIFAKRKLIQNTWCWFDINNKQIYLSQYSSPLYWKIAPKVPTKHNNILQLKPKN